MVWGGRRGRAGRRGGSPGWRGPQCAVLPGELAGGAGEGGGAGDAGGAGGVEGGVEASWSQEALGWTWGWTGEVEVEWRYGGYGSAPILP